MRYYHKIGLAVKGKAEELFDIRRLGVLGSDAYAVVGDQKDLPDIVSGGINWKVRQEIPIAAKLVADKLGGGLGFVKGKDLSAGPFGKLRYYGPGLWLVAAI